MSSQSPAVAPESEYSPRVWPVPLIANTRAPSPESLCTQYTLSNRGLAAMPEASVIASEATVPGLAAIRVLLHAASSTGGFGGGGGGGGRHALATAATITAANPTATLRT